MTDNQSSPQECAEPTCVKCGAPFITSAMAIQCPLGRECEFVRDDETWQSVLLFRPEEQSSPPAPGVEVERHIYGSYPHEQEEIANRKAAPGVEEMVLYDPGYAYTKAMAAKAAPVEPMASQPWDLEPHYSKWVSKLTTDNLHDKSDIALEFAKLEREVDSLKAQLVVAQDEIECQRIGRKQQRERAEDAEAKLAAAQKDAEKLAPVRFSERKPEIGEFVLCYYEEHGTYWAGMFHRKVSPTIWWSLEEFAALSGRNHG